MASFSARTASYRAGWVPAGWGRTGAPAAGRRVPVALSTAPASGGPSGVWRAVVDRPWTWRPDVVFTHGVASDDLEQ